MTEPASIVLVPGYMLDGDLWAECEAGLAAVADPPLRILHADLSKDATIEAMAARLLADAPDRFVLIGFSMGGYVAREAVRLAPARVRALVLIATSSEGDSDIQRQRKKAAAAFNPSKFRGLSRSAILPSVAPAHADGPIIARIQAMGDRLGGEVFARQSALVRTGDTDRLGEISCPTLIVAAEQDQLRSLEEARALHAGIPHSTLAVIEASGHMIPLEAPEALLEIVRPWLRATLADRGPA